MQTADNAVVTENPAETTGTLTAALALCHEAQRTLETDAVGMSVALMTQQAAVTLAEALAPLFENLSAPLVRPFREITPGRRFWNADQLGPAVRQRFLCGRLTTYNIGLAGSAKLIGVLLGEDGKLRVTSAGGSTGGGRWEKPVTDLNVSFSEFAHLAEVFDRLGDPYDHRRDWAANVPDIEEAERVFAVLAGQARSAHQAISAAVERLGLADTLAREIAAIGP